jgi:hypothetical protein
VSLNRGIPFEFQGNQSRVYSIIGSCAELCACLFLGLQMLFAPPEADCQAGTPGTEFSVHIRPEDFIIPICHEGMNRSQVLYLVLHGLKRGYTLPGQERVCVPHGAESGFDPHAVSAVMQLLFVPSLQKRSHRPLLSVVHATRTHTHAHFRSLHSIGYVFCVPGLRACILVVVQAYADINEENVIAYIHGKCWPRGSGGDWVSTCCCVCMLACMCMLVFHV